MKVLIYFINELWTYFILYRIFDVLLSVGIFLRIINSLYLDRATYIRYLNPPQRLYPIHCFALFVRPFPADFFNS